MKEKYRVGIISDTHGLLREEVINTLKTCDYIIHGGDINKKEIIDELKKINGLKDVAIDKGYNLNVHVDEKNINKDLRESLKQSDYVDMDNSTYNFINSRLYTPGDFSISNIKLSEGKFDRKTAKAENGVILVRYSYQESLAKKGKVVLSNYKVGDTITLNVGELKEISENQNANYYDEEQIKKTEQGEQATENEIVNTTSKTYKIVGIIERPTTTIEPYEADWFTVITKMQTINKKANIAVLYTKANDYVKNTENINQMVTAKSGTKENDFNRVNGLDKTYKSYKYKIKINKELLSYQGASLDDDTLRTIYGLGAFIMGIVLVSSVFVIRNGFAISITERLKQYGMLSSIGATKKQIKKSVYFEGFILGIIGIPLGILSGIFAIYILVNVVNYILKDYVSSGTLLTYGISWTAIVVSIIVSIVTIWLSCRRSAKKASKITPIEAIRSSEDVKLKAKKIKCPKIITKIFKTGGEIAYKNLKRSKKKYRTTVISIAVSVFIFITMNAFITNMFDLTGQYYEDYDYNFIVESSKFTDEEINKIVKQESVESYHILYQPKRMYEIRDLSKIHEYGKELITEELSGEKYCGLYLVALDEASFKEYSKKIGVKFEDVKDTGILCDEYNEYDKETGAVELKRLYKYEKGDTIVGEYNKEELKIKVGDVSKIKPYGLERVFYDGGYLVVNKNEFKNIDFSDDVTITIQSNNTTELQTAIEEKDSSLTIVNLEDVAKEEKSMILVTNIFLYGFIAVITLIGVTNIFNTITSNMELRQKEFAMLKSIGMTKKEFNRMINLETLFYGTKSLLYGIILGLLGTLAMYKAFSVKIDAGMYIPIKPIIISVIFVFILIFIIMRYSISKINKQNTIETIRKENI